MNMSVLWNVSYGMYVVGVNDNGKPTGCIVNSLSQITSNDPVFALSINHDNYTYEVIKRTGKFSITILSEKTNPSVISSFGFFSGRDKDKFDGVAYRMEHDLPVLNEHTCGTMVFEVVGETSVDTHSIILGHIIDAMDGEDNQPMTYAYYHKVVKGKAPKNAPTYQETAPEPQKGVSYICNICGFIYEGDLTMEPDDYVCPICGVTKDQFTKQ